MKKKKKEINVIYKFENKDITQKDIEDFGIEFVLTLMRWQAEENANVN